MAGSHVLDPIALGRRLREVREVAGVSQDAARATIAVSQPTYSRIEAGQRTLKGDELVALADLFGVRAASIVGVATLRERAQCGACTAGSQPEMTAMRERLSSYLELDSYLTSQGIA